MTTGQQQDVSTDEVAHFLGASPAFVTKQVDEGRLPHRMVGMIRRVPLENLQNYLRKMRERQESALKRMADNARELRLDYQAKAARSHYCAPLDASIGVTAD